VFECSVARFFELACITVNFLIVNKIINIAQFIQDLRMSWCWNKAVGDWCKASYIELVTLRILKVYGEFGVTSLEIYFCYQFRNKSKRLIDLIRAGRKLLS